MTIWDGLLFLALILGVVALWLVSRRRPTPSSPPVVVEAVLTASAHKQVPLAREIEAAMAEAVRECLARGVSMDDVETIKAAMQAARRRVLHR